MMTERSVTRAAAKVGLSQPALSNALTRLRSLFGDRLFVRGRKEMVPTPRALELAPDISAALDHVNAAFQRPGFRPETSNQTFRLATTDQIELALLPALIKRLDVVAPGITVSCYRLQGIFKVPEADLQSGALDFALGTFPHPAPMDSGRFAQRLYDERLVCVARAGHPVVKQRLNLRQFCNLKHVATYYPGEGPGLIDRVLATKGYKRNMKLSLPHFLSVPFVVAGSDLIATVPDLVARVVGDPLRLRRMPCPVTVPRMQVSLVWHIRTHEDASHKWFRNLMANVSRSLTKRYRP
jgi:DNA-binding transcriptional LysR family regulator